MLFIYPAIFHKEDNSYWVEFPDLKGCQTFGESVDETVVNAKEALEGYCITVLESGQNLPKATDIKNISVDENSFVTLIDCELKNTTRRSVKKTLTIPYWLNEAAVKENINFSDVLQNALKNELHIGQ